jgi:hypothetical protein
MTPRNSSLSNVFCRSFPRPFLSCPDLASLNAKGEQHRGVDSIHVILAASTFSSPIVHCHVQGTFPKLCVLLVKQCGYSRPLELVRFCRT